MPQPSVPKLLFRGATRACPACGNRRRIFSRWVHMADDCPRCGLHFERQPGHFIGGITINTVVTFTLCVASLAAWIVLSWPDPRARVGLALVFPVGIVAPAFFYPISKTLWTAIDIAMRPLTPGEARARP